MTITDTRKTPSTLAAVRAEKDSPQAKAFVALLEQRLDDLRTALVHAGPQDFAGLQGAARLLETLLADIRAEPALRQRRDGAYT